jgi:hypothetical protein
MSNCGCFPVNHTGVIPPAPVEPLGPNCCHDLTPHGDKCVVGGGYESDWCYPCTDYFTPNASDPRNVSGLQGENESLKIICAEWPLCPRPCPQVILRL